MGTAVPQRSQSHVPGNMTTTGTSEALDQLLGKDVLVSVCWSKGTALKEGLADLGRHPTEQESAEHLFTDEVPYKGLHQQ